MPNACFRTHNINKCQAVGRGRYTIPTGLSSVTQPIRGRLQSVICQNKHFIALFFKFGAHFGANDIYDVTCSTDSWSCSCPDFKHQHRDVSKTCCKHIQACIDKEFSLNRGHKYATFLIEHIHNY